MAVSIVPLLSKTSSNKGNINKRSLWIESDEVEEKIKLCSLRESDGSESTELSLRLPSDTPFSLTSVGGDILLLGTLDTIIFDEEEDDFDQDLSEGLGEEEEEEKEKETISSKKMNKALSLASSRMRLDDSHSDSESELSEFDEDELLQSARNLLKRKQQQQQQQNKQNKATTTPSSSSLEPNPKKLKNSHQPSANGQPKKKN